MNDQWAAENLQVIRTLMERSAVYRRALAPVMTVAGLIGTVAALAGWKVGIHSAQGFLLYWLAIAVVAVVAGMFLIRRQALQQGEVFWSPPTRRVSQAMCPAMVAGLALGVIAAFALPVAQSESSTGSPGPNYLTHVIVPLGWVILYGCAIHAAGFFIQRGVRLFGWVLLILGCALFLIGTPDTSVGLADLGYLIMGLVFGLLHLLYGLYLFATEKKPAAE